MPENDNNLKELLHEKSFKIKPIILELENYAYYHSPIQEKAKDSNKRFIGRKNIIDKIRSFVYETTMNKGAYLVTGYRGMGKTSVINEALSQLKTHSKTKEYILLWMFLLPFIFIRNEEINFVKTPFFISIYIIYVILLGRFIAYKSGKKPFKSIKPRFERSLFTFEKLSWYFLIYSIALGILLLFFFGWFDFKIDQTEFNDHLVLHRRFWFVTLGITCAYLARRITDEISVVFKIAALDVKLFYYLILFPVLGFFFYFITMVDFNLSIKVLLVLCSILIIIKIRAKYLQKKNIIYNSRLSRYKYFLDFQEYLTIKVNLGKDKLTEKDVLKYINDELYIKYYQWYHTN